VSGRPACRKDAWFVTKHRSVIQMHKDDDVGESFFAVY
jgi:hypothetical protein